MTYKRRKRHHWEREGWSTDECDANYICPLPRLPGDHLCSYHRAVEDAKAGDEEAISVCRDRYGLEVVHG